MMIYKDNHNQTYYIVDTGGIWELDKHWLERDIVGKVAHKDRVADFLKEFGKSLHETSLLEILVVFGFDKQALLDIIK